MLLLVGLGGGKDVPKENKMSKLKTNKHYAKARELLLNRAVDLFKEL